MKNDGLKRYEFTNHTADIGVKVFGGSLKELFENTAFCMFDIIADLEGLKETTSIDVELNADSTEELLVRWLDELLFNFYTKWIIFFRFDISELSSVHLKAKAYGRHVGENRNRLKTEIKAATYHGLEIKKEDGIYTVQIVFDI